MTSDFNNQQQLYGLSERPALDSSLRHSLEVRSQSDLGSVQSLKKLKSPLKELSMLPSMPQQKNGIQSVFMKQQQQSALKPEDHLDSPSLKNLQYVFNFYAQQSYQAIGSSPTFQGIDQAIKLIRVADFKKILSDFQIDFQVKQWNLNTRFTQLSMSRGSVSQIDFKAFVTLIYELFEKEIRRHYDVMKKPVIKDQNGNIMEVYIVWAKVKKAFFLDSRKELKQKLQQIARGGKARMENVFDQPLDQRGSTRDLQMLLNRDKEIYPQMPQISNKYKTYRNSIQNGSKDLSQSPPALSIKLSEREKIALKQHVKIKKLEKELNLDKNRNYQTQLKLNATLSEEKRKMKQLEYEDPGVINKILRKLKNKKNSTNQYGNRWEQELDRQLLEERAADEFNQSQKRMMALNAQAKIQLKELSAMPQMVQTVLPEKQQPVVLEANEDDEASQKTNVNQGQKHLEKFQKTVDIEMDYLKLNEESRKFREQQEHVLQQTLKLESLEKELQSQELRKSIKLMKQKVKDLSRLDESDKQSELVDQFDQLDNYMQNKRETGEYEDEDDKIKGKTMTVALKKMQDKVRDLVEKTKGSVGSRAYEVDEPMRVLANYSPRNSTKDQLELDGAVERMQDRVARMINNDDRDIESEDIEDHNFKKINSFSEKVPDDQQHLRNSLKKMKRKVDDLVRDDETFERPVLGSDELIQVVDAKDEEEDYRMYFDSEGNPINKDLNSSIKQMQNKMNELTQKKATSLTDMERTQLKWLQAATLDEQNIDQKQLDKVLRRMQKGVRDYMLGKKQQPDTDDLDLPNQQRIFNNSVSYQPLKRRTTTNRSDDEDDIDQFDLNNSLNKMQRKVRNLLREKTKVFNENRRQNEVVRGMERLTELRKKQKQLEQEHIMNNDSDFEYYNDDYDEKGLPKLDVEDELKKAKNRRQFIRKSKPRFSEDPVTIQENDEVDLQNYFTLDQLNEVLDNNNINLDDGEKNELASVYKDQLQINPFTSSKKQTPEQSKQQQFSNLRRSQNTPINASQQIQIQQQPRNNKQDFMIGMQPELGRRIPTNQQGPDAANFSSQVPSNQNNQPFIQNQPQYSNFQSRNQFKNLQSGNNASRSTGNLQQQNNQNYRFGNGMNTNQRYIPPNDNLFDQDINLEDSNDFWYGRNARVTRQQSNFQPDNNQFQLVPAINPDHPYSNNYQEFSGQQSQPNQQQLQLYDSSRQNLPIARYGMQTKSQNGIFDQIKARRQSNYSSNGLPYPSLDSRRASFLQNAGGLQPTPLALPSPQPENPSFQMANQQSQIQLHSLPLMSPERQQDDFTGVPSDQGMQRYRSQDISSMNAQNNHRNQGYGSNIYGAQAQYGQQGVNFNSSMGAGTQVANTNYETDRERGNEPINIDQNQYSFNNQRNQSSDLIQNQRFQASGTQDTAQFQNMNQPISYKGSNQQKEGAIDNVIKSQQLSQQKIRNSRNYSQRKNLQMLTSKSYGTQDQIVNGRGVIGDQEQYQNYQTPQRQYNLIQSQRVADIQNHKQNTQPNYQQNIQTKDQTNSNQQQQNDQQIENEPLNLQINNSNDNQTPMYSNITAKQNPENDDAHIRVAMPSQGSENPVQTLSQPQKVDDSHSRKSFRSDSKLDKETEATTEKKTAQKQNSYTPNGIDNVRQYSGTQGNLVNQRSGISSSNTKLKESSNLLPELKQYKQSSNRSKKPPNRFDQMDKQLSKIKQNPIRNILPGNQLKTSTNLHLRYNEFQKQQIENQQLLDSQNQKLQSNRGKFKATVEKPPPNRQSQQSTSLKKLKEQESEMFARDIEDNGFNKGTSRGTPVNRRGRTNGVYL